MGSEFIDKEFLAVEEGRNFINGKKPTWHLLREYINSFPVGTVITRQGIFKGINRKTSGIDSYTMQLKAAYILKPYSRGKYEIVHHIPEDLGVQELLELAYDQENWKKWFTETLEERRKQLRERKHGTK